MTTPNEQSLYDQIDSLENQLAAEKARADKAETNLKASDRGWRIATESFKRWKLRALKVMAKRRARAEKAEAALAESTRREAALREVLALVESHADQYVMSESVRSKIRATFSTPKSPEADVELDRDPETGCGYTKCSQCSAPGGFPHKMGCPHRAPEASNG